MANGKGGWRRGSARVGGRAGGAGGVRLPKWARFGSREEIQRTLAASIVALVRGRITLKQSWAIGQTAEVQLRLLGMMEQLEEMMREEEQGRSQNAEGRTRQRRWVN